MYKIDLDTFYKLFKRSTILSSHYALCLDWDTKREPYKAELWEAGYLAGLDAAEAGKLGWLSTDSVYNQGYNRGIEAFKKYLEVQPNGRA